MRRWLSVLAGVATVALTGTALALAGSAPEAGEVAITETTVVEKVTTTTYGEAFSPERVAVHQIEYETKAQERPSPKVEPELPTDRTPPHIEVLHPAEGQVFENAEVAFEGKVERGALVLVGDRRAEVSDEGSWRIVLELEAGENLIEFKARDGAANWASATVMVVYERPQEPEKPEIEEPKKEKPKVEEPEKPKAEEPEKPKEEKPEDEKPAEHEAEWEFVAHQLYGACAETPPYDVFHGKGKPGSLIKVVSEYGHGSVEVGEHGEWEIKVIFESAPVDAAFPVKVKDQFGNYQVFEFVHTS